MYQWVNIQVSSSEGSGEDKFVNAVKALIMGFPHEDSDDEVQLGMAHMSLVQNTRWVMEHSEEIADLISDQWAIALAHIGYEYEPYGNFAYLDRIEIQNDFRNRGVGRIALEQILELLHNLGVKFVLLKAYPFELDNYDKPDKEKRVFDLVQRLARFYSRCGFKLIHEDGLDVYMMCVIM